MLSNQNFGPVRRGDTYRVNFALQDANGAPLMLVDVASASLTWRWSLYAGGPAIGQVAATLIDGGNGSATAQVLIPTDDVGLFFHELEMLLSGDTSTMAVGSYNIEQDIG